MTEVIKHKTLHCEFGRLELNENDLYRLAKIVENIASTYDGKPDIVVTSSDEEETYRATSSDFILSEQFPPCIASVTISFSRYGMPVSCKVSLSARPRGISRIEVDGTNTNAVAAAYHELARELKTREKAFSNLVLASEKNTLSKLITWAIYSSFVAASIYSIFDIPLNIALQVNPSFIHTKLYTAIGNIGWVCVAIGFMVGNFVLDNYLKKWFPPVEFSGRLSDQSSKSRRYLLILASFIVAPIIVNVISESVIKAINH
jgi:hypothetical protein